MKAIFLCAAILTGTVESKNFVVQGQNPEFTKECAEFAEQWRMQLGYFWVGKPLPDWKHPCPVKLDTITRRGGVTMISQPIGDSPNSMDMTVSGSEKEIIESVLPHEINHAVMHTIIGRPFTRWADEGAACYVELEQYRDILRDGLKQDQSTYPFKQLIAMKQYPPDVMNIYYQGHSMVSHLVSLKGPQKYVEFLNVAGKSGWEQAAQTVYSYPSLDEWENGWKAWLRDGEEDWAYTRARPVLIVFTTRNCHGCDQFKVDRQNPSLSARYDVHVCTVEPDGTCWDDLNVNGRNDGGEEENVGRQAQANFQKETGTFVSSYPVFWVVKSGQYKVGYQGLPGLLHWIGAVIKQFAGLIFQGEPIRPPRGDVAPVTPMPNGPPIAGVDPMTEPEATSNEPIDWSMVTLVVAVKNLKESSSYFGAISDVAIKLAKGILSRKLSEMTDGKAGLYIVYENEQPEAYKALTEAASIAPDPLYILVLVEKQHLGLAKGIIASKIEGEALTALKESKSGISKAPVEVILERMHSKVYLSVKEITERVPPTSNNFSLHVLISGLIGALGGYGVRSLKSKVLGKVVSKVETAVTHKEPEPSITI